MYILYYVLNVFWLRTLSRFILLFQARNNMNLLDKVSKQWEKIVYWRVPEGTICHLIGYQLMRTGN